MDVEPGWVVAICAGAGTLVTLVAHIKNDASKNMKNREQFRRFRKEVKKFMEQARRELPK